MLFLKNISFTDGPDYATQVPQQTWDQGSYLSSISESLEGIVKGNKGLKTMRRDSKQPCITTVQGATIQEVQASYLKFNQMPKQCMQCL